jgi:hypothetical protein
MQSGALHIISLVKQSWMDADQASCACSDLVDRPLLKLQYSLTGAAPPPLLTRPPLNE